MPAAGIRDNFYRRLGPCPLVELLDGIDCSVLEGQFSDLNIEHAAPLDQAGLGDISYFEGRKAKDSLSQIKASACFVTEANAGFIDGKSCLAIVTQYPRAAFARIMGRLYEPHPYGDCAQEVFENVELASGVVVGVGVQIGSGTTIGPNSVIGPGVTIGKNCKIGANVVVEFSYIGNDCTLQHGAVIGANGFGVAQTDDGGVDIPHIGHVVIEDNVSIGCHTSIDRAMFGATHIGSGCKFDNQVQIAHNVTIGRNCMFAAHVGISGSCVIGDNVIMGGKVGVTDHITIGTGAVMAAGSAAMKDVPPGEMWSGVPAQPIRQHMREVMVIRRLTKKKNGHKS